MGWKNVCCLHSTERNDFLQRACNKREIVINHINTQNYNKNISFLWWVSKIYCLFIPAATKVLVFSTIGLVFPTSLQNANLEIIFVLCMADVYTSYWMEMQQRTERLQFEVSTLCCKLVAYTCLRRRFITLTNIVISTSFIIASDI